MHDIDVIKRELPIDLLEVFYVTPLPGSEDHLKPTRAGVPLNPDLKKYDLNHICTTHPKMAQQEWSDACRMAWQRYYTFEHAETVMRRADACRSNVSNVLFLITCFMGRINFENNPSARMRLPALEIPPRPSARCASPGPTWSFYPKYFGETTGKLFKWAALYIKMSRVYLDIKHDPQRADYTDVALTPVGVAEAETHDLFGSESADAYVAHAKRVKQAQAGESAEPASLEAAE